MEAITYDLRSGPSGADGFYRALAGLAGATAAFVEEQAGGLLSGYAAFLSARGEASRSRGEYSVELLTLGVAWRQYGPRARRSSRAAMRAGRGLFRLRRAFPRLKPLVDPLRGWLASRSLMAGEGGPALPLDLRSFARLLSWLDASGEFKDEVKRLRLWHAFAGTRGDAFCAQLCGTALVCRDWFAENAARDLGAWTAGVGRFLRERHPAYAGREDRIFCGKTPLEYHLGMLSAELTNQGLRAAFEATPARVVLLPACMRRAAEHGCRARDVDGELRCSLCSPQCAVGRVTRLGLERAFTTRIIPHSSSFTRSLLRYRDSRERGVVAVACALNIVPGGYEMRELRIPSQCVLLDYAGCARHWHPTGVPTDLDDQRLLATVTAAS